jgi:lipopolysaccharide/colanic/teichoic acid biosynthesis glycosyltransferase
MSVTLSHRHMATQIQFVAGAPSQWGGRIDWSFYPVFKRIVDVAASLILLITTLPLWIGIAIAIKLDSPGPVFFVQERVGFMGQRFRCIKFRTMQIDAEARLEEMRRRGEVVGPVYKLRRDPRVTRVGRLLRRTSLDELPQLVNVLKGEMSLVGPRPCIPAHVKQFRAEDLIRQTAKPGLTCLWVIRGRSDGTVEGWMSADREYVSRQSLWLDAWILLKTVFIVLSCRGAY